jgi:hypothetical protein
MKSNLWRLQSYNDTDARPREAMCVMCVPTHNATHQFRYMERPGETKCASAASSGGLRGSKFPDRLNLELQDSNVICYSADIHLARKCMSPG